MVVGSVIVAVCLVVLGWTKEIVGVFISDPDTARTWTIVVAVMSIYAVDFAINAGTLRADEESQPLFNYRKAMY
jgi:solute carrier family 45, member 1/2/4